jgi:hypothetical protein
MMEPSENRIEVVAKMTLDIGGNNQVYILLYTVKKIDGHDIILGLPWMKRQNVIPLP